jgi:membrane protein YqaA with SNARE-associated domain
MIKKMNHWYFKWSKTSFGPIMLFIAAFADASFFPMPVLILFITLSLAKTQNSILYSTSAIIGTLAGAIGGWSIGHFLMLNKDSEFTRLALFMFDHIPGLSINLYEDIRLLYEKWDMLILFSAILTPIPFKYFTVAAGIFDMNLIEFIAVTVISQGAKFFLVALLIRKYGVKINIVIRNYFKPIAILLTASIILAIIVIKIF